MLAELLEEEGFNVHTASNGFSGLRLAEEHRPQLVVLDLALPELSGAEVLKELRGNHLTRDSAIVVVSGNPTLLSEPQLLDVEAVVQKPFDAITFMATCHRAVKKASSRAAEVHPVAPVVPGHVVPRRTRRSAERRTRGRR
jgi:two-component system, OmpR family, KDP operon response regulator KdpE